MDAEGDEHDRLSLGDKTSGGGLRVALELLEDLGAAEVRQVEIEQDDVGQVLTDQLEAAT